MECPIKNHAVETGTYRGKSSTRECCKAECAWWDAIKMCCAILTIADANLIYRGSFAKYVEDEDKRRDE